MDLPAAYAQLSPVPVVITISAAIAPGAFFPQIVPLSALPPTARAVLLMRADAPLEDRVAALLLAGCATEAWTLLDRERVRAPGRIDLLLADWSERERARLDLPPAKSDVILGLGAERLDAAAGALADTRELLTPLWANPVGRWSGPLVIVAGDAFTIDLPTVEGVLARPALPAIRLTATTLTREDTAAAIAELLLARQRPPAAGWPRWLRSGVAGVARAKTRGDGPSPRAMQELRVAAGAAALTELLNGDRDDAPLATAVCALLTHARRRAHLPTFLDALRNGSSAAGALQLAYGLTPELLLTER